MVQHRGRDGELHLYSSKPPLLATILAGEYWLIHRLTGWTLGDHPYEIGRVMLFTVNILPLVLMYVLLARLVERFGTTDWGRIFVMAAATLGTFLNTFAVVLNNHIVAAVSATIALYAFVRISATASGAGGISRSPGWPPRSPPPTNCRPSRCWPSSGLLLLWRAPRETLLAFVPGVLRRRRRVLRHELDLPTTACGRRTCTAARPIRTTTGTTTRTPSTATSGKATGSTARASTAASRRKLLYALHALVGHHGIFSLTPIWLLSVVGIVDLAAIAAIASRRELAAMIAGLTLVCLVFYIGLRPQEDRNYGGMTSGFRWMFWFAPLWLVVMLPAADRLARSTAAWRSPRCCSRSPCSRRVIRRGIPGRTVDLQLARVVRLAGLLRLATESEHHALSRFAKQNSSASDVDRRKPFCSERCRTIDLGRWLGETYGLPAVPDPEADELPEPDADGDRSHERRTARRVARHASSLAHRPIAPSASHAGLASAYNRHA